MSNFLFLHIALDILNLLEQIESAINELRSRSALLSVLLWLPSQIMHALKPIARVLINGVLTTYNRSIPGAIRTVCEHVMTEIPNSVVCFNKTKFLLFFVEMYFICFYWLYIPLRKDVAYSYILCKVTMLMLPLMSLSPLERLPFWFLGFGLTVFEIIVGMWLITCWGYGIDGENAHFYHHGKKHYRYRYASGNRQITVELCQGLYPVLKLSLFIDVFCLRKKGEAERLKQLVEGKAKLDKARTQTMGGLDFDFSSWALEHGCGFNTNSVLLLSSVAILLGCYAKLFVNTQSTGTVCFAAATPVITISSFATFNLLESVGSIIFVATMILFFYIILDALLAQKRSAVKAVGSSHTAVQCLDNDGAQVVIVLFGIAVSVVCVVTVGILPEPTALGAVLVSVAAVVGFAAIVTPPDSKRKLPPLSFDGVKENPSGVAIRKFLKSIGPKPPSNTQPALVQNSKTPPTKGGLDFELDYLTSLLEQDTVANLRYGILFLLALSSLGVYSIILAGGSSNSKYAFIGALRSAAQMISYEVAISLIILPIVLLAGSLNLTMITYVQSITVWFLWPLLPVSILFLIAMLAETNRTPFDLPEAEAELVAGYNVDYSSLPFAMFFLGEYCNMILISTLYCILFLGGGLNSVGISSALILSLKAALTWIFFVLVRATLPRYRYDQLMDIGGKVFLPIAGAFLLVVFGLLVYFNALPVANELPLVSSSFVASSTHLYAKYVHPQQCSPALFGAPSLLLNSAFNIH